VRPTPTDRGQWLHRFGPNSRSQSAIPGPRSQKGGKVVEPSKRPASSLDRSRPASSLDKRPAAARGQRRNSMGAAVSASPEAPGEDQTEGCTAARVRKGQRELTGKPTGTPAWGGQSAFGLQNTEEVGADNQATITRAARRFQCGPLPPQGQWRRQADGSLHRMWTPPSTSKTIDSSRTRLGAEQLEANRTPAWCSEAYASIRGSQVAWDEPGPMRSTYMQDIGGDDKSLKQIDPQPQYRPCRDNILKGRPRGRPSSPSEQLNVINYPTRIY